MKKAIFALATILLGLLWAGAASAGPVERTVIINVGSIQAQVNGQGAEMPAPAVIIDGRTLVPLRFVSEAFGCDVRWNEETRTASVKLADHVIEVPIDKSGAVVNGFEAPVQVPARIIDGLTFVPLRFVVESLGAKVDFDSVSYKITITLREYRNETMGFKMILPPGWEVSGEEEGRVNIAIQGQGYCIIGPDNEYRGRGKEDFSSFADEWLKGYESGEKLLEEKHDDTAGVIIREGALFKINSVKLVESGVYQVEAGYPVSLANTALAREYGIVLYTLSRFSGNIE